MDTAMEQRVIAKVDAKCGIQRVSLVTLLIVVISSVGGI